MRKIIKSAFCAMLAVLLTGCSGKDSAVSSYESSEAQSVSTSVSESSQETPPAVADSAPSEPENYYATNFPSYTEIAAQYPDKTVLTWAIIKTGYERNAPFATRAVNEYLSEKGCDFVVCFDPNVKELENADIDPFVAGVLDVIGNGGQIDIISPMNYTDCVKTRLYEPLNDYLDSEKGKALTELMPRNFWESLKINGNIYGICCNPVYTLSLDEGYFVNAELAEKYGFDISKPVSEQLNILNEVKENEPDCDIYVMYTSRAGEIIYNADVKEISGLIYLNEETQRFECVLDNEEYIEQLKTLDTLNKNELITDRSRSFDDNYKNTFFIMSDNIAGGKLGYADVDSVEIKYGGKTVKAVPVFDGTSSIRNCPAATGINAASANKDKAFELLSLVYTDPYLNNLLTFGSEDAADEIQNPFNAIRFSNPVICHQYGENFSNETTRRIFENAYIHEGSGFIFDEANVADEMKKALAVMDNFALPDKDAELEQVLSEIRENLNTAGLQKIIDEANRQYKEYAE